MMREASLTGFALTRSRCRLYCIFGNDCGQVFVTVDGVRRPEPVPLFDRDCTYYRAAVLPVFAGEEGIHEVTVELDSEQPDRSAVGSEATSNPKKYDGIRWYCGGVLLLGDLDLTPLTDPSDGSVRHVDGPRVAIGRAPREIPGANGKTSRFDGAVPPADDRAVGLTMTFSKTESFRTVTYEIDGVLCSSLGRTSLPVVATDAVSVVKYAGRGSLRLLTGEAERRRKGLVLVVR